MRRRKICSERRRRSSCSRHLKSRCKWGWKIRCLSRRQNCCVWRWKCYIRRRFAVQMKGVNIRRRRKPLRMDRNFCCLKRRPRTPNYPLFPYHLERRRDRRRRSAISLTKSGRQRRKYWRNLGRGSNVVFWWRSNNEKFSIVVYVASALISAAALLIGRPILPVTFVRIF